MKVRRPSVAAPGGFTVVEALVSLLLLGALLQICWAVAAAQRRSLVALGRRSDVLAAERTVWWVLSTETAAGVAGRDWSREGPDVLAIRAFRGRAVACPVVPDPDGWVPVRYRGRRWPRPGKDSVLVLDVRGRWSVRDLVDRASDAPACPASSGERSERWRLDPPPARPVVLARLFERGSYHIEDPAFRYRRGRAGRQPLTPEVLDPSGSGIESRADGVVVRFRGAATRAWKTGAVADTGWARALRGG